MNGVIFPGGEADLSPTAPFGRTAKLVFDKGMEFIQNGESFPMHGTCLGLEVRFTVIEMRFVMETWPIALGQSRMVISVL